jgi:hypothetical protein
MYEYSKNKQQQHSLLSQASWGRLEMKPKRDESHKIGGKATITAREPNGILAEKHDFSLS